MLDDFPKLLMIPGVQPSKVVLCFTHLSHKLVASRLKSCVVSSTLYIAFLLIPYGLFQVLAHPRKISARG